MSHRRPGFAGEDTSPTTEREVNGWYSYGIAAEVFAVCGLGSFLPVTLEQLARENGVLRVDGVTSCVQPAARALAARADEADNACVVNVLGAHINTSSFALYTFSIAVGVQAIVLISISAIADHGSYRKKFLMILAYTGAVASMLFLFVSPKIFLLAPILVIIGVSCLGNSFALLNSFIPVLVANHPDAENEAARWHPAASSASEGDSGSAAPGLQLSNHMSARGMGLGYAAALVVQIFSIIILVLNNQFHFTSSSTLPMRFILFIVGAWWAIFSIPTYLWLRQRPGPRLPNIPITAQRWLQPLHYIAFAWRSLYHTLQIALKLKQVVLFLIAWFLLSDSIATVSGVAILFARTELHMGTAAIACVSITGMTSGIAGATLWPKIQKKYGMKSNQVIMACICLFELIPLYGLLGFILPVLGLRQAWEIFPLAVIHGLVMGGLSSFCRAFFAVLIPPGSEAAFYALYAVTDKGSSVIGPAIVGRIVDATGSVRMGFWFLAVLIVLPIPLIQRVDSEQGREDAVRMSRMLQKTGGDDGGRMGTLGGVSEGDVEEFALLEEEDDVERS